MKKSNLKIIPLLFDTYLALIKNSVGAKTFRNSYAKVGGKKKDILENGGLSCAFFVSSILVICGLIREIHATVGGTQKDLKKSGWKMIKKPFDSAQSKPKIGSVIVWEAVNSGRGVHKHIGFYVGNGKAISNHHKKGFPVVHHWTFGEKNGKDSSTPFTIKGRKVEAIYWNERLK